MLSDVIVDKLLMSIRVGVVRVELVNAGNFTLRIDGLNGLEKIRILAVFMEAMVICSKSGNLDLTKHYELFVHNSMGNQQENIHKLRSISQNNDRHQNLQLHCKYH